VIEEYFKMAKEEANIILSYEYLPDAKVDLHKSKERKSTSKAKKKHKNKVAIEKELKEIT